MPKKNSRKRPLDLRKLATRQRQDTMASYLKRFGLDRHVVKGQSGKMVPKPYCQHRAADLRWKLEKKAIKTLRDIRPDEVLVMVTLVLPWAKSDHLPFDPAILRRIQSRMQAIFMDAEEVVAIIGAVEADFNRIEGMKPYWEHTVHLLARVKASKPSEVTGLLKGYLDLEPTATTRRPVMTKSVYDVAGAARYIFKSLALGPVCERSTWFGRNTGPRARTFTRKIRLKRPQLANWLSSLALHDLSDRVIWHPRAER